MEWPSSQSRSKATYATGTSFMRRRTAESEARCMRDWSSSKLGRPSESNATTSPSRISRRDPSALAMARTSG